MRRGTTRRQIERCCQMGTIEEGPFKNERLEWQDRNVSLFGMRTGQRVPVQWLHDPRNRLRHRRIDREFRSASRIDRLIFDQAGARAEWSRVSIFETRN